MPSWQVFSAKPWPTAEPSWMDGPSLPKNRPDPIIKTPPSHFRHKTDHQFISNSPASWPSTWGIPEPIMSISPWMSLPTIKEISTATNNHTNTNHGWLWICAKPHLETRINFSIANRNKLTTIPTKIPTTIPFKIKRKRVTSNNNFLCVSSIIRPLSLICKKESWKIIPAPL